MGVVILPASGPLYQLGVFFLLASVVCSDLLLLRLMLVVGFLFLMLWGALGVCACVM